MKVTLIPVTPFQQNCSLLVCEKTGRAAVVDPGGDLDRIEQEVARQNVQVEKVLLTHGHIDHCAGAKTLATHYGVPIEGRRKKSASGSRSCRCRASASAFRPPKPSSRITG